MDSFAQFLPGCPQQGTSSVSVGMTVPWDLQFQVWEPRQGSLVSGQPAQERRTRLAPQAVFSLSRLT